LRRDVRLRWPGARPVDFEGALISSLCPIFIFDASIFREETNMATPLRPIWAHKRPAPRKAPGAPPSLKDTVTWTRIVEPRERYRIVYRDRDNAMTERTIELQKVGHSGDTEYFGVMHAGKFKTLRVDRVVSVMEQLTTGHESSIRPQPTYSTQLPAWPFAGAVFKISQTAASRHNRTWTVDLNHYTCSCPEKRIRTGMGYEPGQLGYVCDHMAKAILANLSADAAGWPPELLNFLRNPRKIHIDNLS